MNGKMITALFGLGLSHWALIAGVFREVWFRARVCKGVHQPKNTTHCHVFGLTRTVQQVELYVRTATKRWVWDVFSLVKAVRTKRGTA